jgi:exodeoxyribonuclease VII large subunit
MKKRKAAADSELGLKLEEPGSSASQPLTVGVLTGEIREILEQGLGDLWVTGEISNLRAPASGHLYFTLKDASATLAAVMFRMEAARIGFVLQDGMAVVARGAITVYEARGQYQLQVSEIRARGQGGLTQRFEELKRKLQAEDLFALERKRPLPVFPERVGVVTSLQGAVLQDMLQILKRRAPGVRLFVRGVRVQGPGAAHEIAEAIRAFSRERAMDVVVVARGGGSLEDLWAFNEEEVARALADCSIPTISAVGHETDFSIADFVADLRAPTPSAAAELLTRDWNDWRKLVLGLRQRLDREARRVLQTHRRHHTILSSSAALREPRRVVRQWLQRVDDLRENLHETVRENLRRRATVLQALRQRLKMRHPSRELQGRQKHLNHLEARLRALGPQATLDRGYALVLDTRHHAVARAEELQNNQSFHVVLSRGAVTARVEQTLPSATLLDTLQAGEVVAVSVPARKKAYRKKLPTRPKIDPGAA